MIHGHFLGMGGLTLVDPHPKDSRREIQSKEVQVFDLEQFRLDNPDFQCLLTRITDDDTEDRFKSDALSKIIAILQLTWFIIHCIAHRQQRLALSHTDIVSIKDRVK